jgi:diguanylate cyclase (GGDEF)-like protein
VVLAGVLRSTGAGPWVYLVVATFGTVLSAVGAQRMAPSRRRSWTAFAVSQVLYLIADVIWATYDHVLDRGPSPSVADVFYLASYPAIALGLWWLTAARRRGRDRASFLDAAIITTGVSVIGVVFFIAPSAEASSASTFDEVLAAAYPVGDLLLLALAIRLLTSGMGRNPAGWLLLGAVVSLLVPDVFADITIESGASYPLGIDSAFLLSFVLLGVAPLHPSARDLSEPRHDHDGAALTLSRVSLLGVALVLAPAAGLVAHLTGFAHAPWAVFVGGSLAAILVVLRLWDLVQDLQEKAVQLDTLARRDSLTGVANRRTWDEELRRACEFAREQRAPLTVAVLDMDHFKQFNDTHGHLAGDGVLTETASAWASVLDGRGFVARYGGEEFTALLPQLTGPDAHPILVRMLHAVTHGQTCSIGAATWDGVEEPASLMARADRALYQAKHAGRDRIAVDHDGVVTVGGQPVPASARLACLRTVYQPVIEIESGEIVGAEALSRFDGLDPRRVFDAAAKEGTGAELEAAAIRSALAGWNHQGILALNVSLSALVTPLLQEALRGDLTGIVLEITETDLVEYGSEMMHALEEPRSRGAMVAIDDFGVGFSNVHRIAKIHPDVVKLDMSLIRDIDDDPALQAVTTACVLFAELTGAKILAEGIETEAERACVQRLGVHLAQGYLFGRPGPHPPVVRSREIAPGADRAVPS